ncbi:hypothetical protein [Roseateles sp. LKC17W]|uniref:Uncharacterized protein n=1 Tax=Pelomonas margarita TaxID=3299031 RepID=A0ABW7FQK6_9BURK
MFSVALDVTVPAASLKTFAQGQMSGARSLAISLATVTSPVMAAIFPTTVPDKMRLSDRDRLELLFSAVVEIDQFKPNAAESLTFEIPRELRLLWASNNGKTSAKASARIEGGAGAGVGVATASASADVGGSISRELTFESFDTYLIQDTALQPSSSMSIKELRALVSDLVASASTSSPDTMNAGVVINRFQASFRDFTKTLCDLKWKPDTSADGSVSTGWDQNTNMCVISFKPAPGWTAVPSVKLKVNGLAPRTPEFWLTVDMPLVGKL